MGKNIKCVRCKKTFNANDINLNTKIICSRIKRNDPLMKTNAVACPFCGALYPIEYEVENGE